MIWKKSGLYACMHVCTHRKGPWKVVWIWKLLEELGIYICLFMYSLGGRQYHIWIRYAMLQNKNLLNLLSIIVLNNITNVFHIYIVDIVHMKYRNVRSTHKKVSFIYMKKNIKKLTDKRRLRVIHFFFLLLSCRLTTVCGLSWTGGSSIWKDKRKINQCFNRMHKI